MIRLTCCLCMNIFIYVRVYTNYHQDKYYVVNKMSGCMCIYIWVRHWLRIFWLSNGLYPDSKSMRQMHIARVRNFKSCLVKSETSVLNHDF